MTWLSPLALLFALLSALLSCGGCHLIFPFGVTATDAAPSDVGRTADSATADSTLAPDGDAGTADAGGPTLLLSGEQALFGVSAKNVPPGGAAVDPDHAFVLCSFRSAGSEPFNAATCQLGPSGLTITVGSASAATHVRWHVVQLAGATTQRGHALLKATETQLTIPLQQVDPGQAFVIVTSRTSSSNRDADEQWLVAARLVGATTLQLARGEAGTQVDVEWQVVELDGARVHSGATTFHKDAKLATRTIAQVDRGRSFLLHSAMAAPETEGVEARWTARGRIVDGTTIELARGATGAQLDLQWFVVELGAGRALHGLGSIVGSATSANPSLGATVVEARALPLISSSFTDAAHGSFLDEVALTAKLAGASALMVERGDASSSVDYAWSVVELPP